MRYISGLINIAIGLAITAIGFVALFKYFCETEKKIKYLETFLTEGVQTMGDVDSVYSKITIKGKTYYNANYFFEVKGEKYSGSFEFASLDDIVSKIPVRYMPDSPIINEVYIETQLAEARHGEKPSTNLIIGIGALSAGLFFIFFRGIKRFRTPEP